MRTHSRKTAWVQGAVMVAVIAATGLSLAIRLHRPFDRDTLAIQIAQLRSSAAEAQLLADSAHADQLAPGFVRHHARQMAQKVDTTNSKLKRPAQPGLNTQKAQAQLLGATLHGGLELLGRKGPAPAVPGFDATSRALDALHDQLKPAL